jgi:hypothetical protein
LLGEFNEGHLRGHAIHAELQLCSAMRSSFLLRIHDSTRKTISMTMPIPEKASFNSFSEIWPNAWPAETTPDPESDRIPQKTAGPDEGNEGAKMKSS